MLNLSPRLHSNLSHLFAIDKSDKATDSLILCWPAGKMDVWSPLYYGDLPYLLSAAAAGDMLQFFALQRNSTTGPIALGPRLQLTQAPGRALATVAVINLHRLLRATQASYPRYVLPVDLWLRHPKPELGYVRSL